MLKHFTIDLICFAFISCALSAPRFSASSPDITVTLDGAVLSFDVPPQIINERTMVPMRVIFEALGANVEWDDATQTITALSHETIIVIQIDSPTMLVDNEELLIDEPPRLVAGRTLVPVRVIAESLDMDVNWDDATRTVIITSPSTQAKFQPVAFTYADPEFGMTLLINNIDWTFYRERNPNRVLFFNNVNPCMNSLIAISAFPFLDNAPFIIERLWGEMKYNHSATPATFVYQDPQVIQVGFGQYHGYLHSFEATTAQGTLISTALFWSASDMIYIATTSATEQTADEVRGVLESILSSFMSASLFGR